MKLWGVAEREQPSEILDKFLGYYPVQQVYAVRARSKNDQRGLLYVYKAMKQLLQHASGKFRRIHLQLLASGGTDKMDSRPFPPRFAFMEMMRAIGDWRRSSGSENCRLTLYVEVYMDLGSGRIDVAELLNCQDVRFWAEIPTASGGIERRLFQEDRMRTLRDIADALNMSVEHWKVEVTPPQILNQSSYVSPTRRISTKRWRISGPCRAARSTSARCARSGVASKRHCGATPTNAGVTGRVCNDIQPVPPCPARIFIG
jgi:hypothetical protein